mgnify:FL=1
MASCLGLYIEKNIIKYAKVTKEREVLKIESFGMKFYDRLDESIKQIISETYSYKNPVSINLSEEMYNYFYMFNLLNKNDLKKAIETEFESYCFDKSLNKNAFESRYALSNDVEDKDKIKVIYVSANKATVSRITQLTEDVKASTITPIGTSITNIANVKPKENFLIVNMEDKTTVTAVVNQKVYNVDKLDEGAEEILGKISAKENSYAKAYEICKNSTIYTMEGKELQDDDNEYLDDIMPTLYKIVNKVQEYTVNSTIKFDKIYITGTMSVVNNIDLYFQEFFKTEKCEILKPYFVTENVKINVKDYIEVNSAIALALQGLGYGIKSMNFKSPGFLEKLPDLMKMEIGSSKGNNKKSSNSLNINFSDLKTKMDHTERWLLRVAGGILALTLIYSVFSGYLNNQITNKLNEVDEVYTDTLNNIGLIEKDNSSVKQKTNKYIELTDNLKNINQEIKEASKSKDVIPNLLMQIMYIIPEDVQITEIENTTGSHIVIKAQSKKYEQLGYFKAKIKEDNILKKKTVVSSQGEVEGEFVKIVIEGDLPWKNY